MRITCHELRSRCACNKRLYWQEAHNQAQSGKLRKTANTSTAIARDKTSFTNTVQSVLNYSRTVEKDYAVRFAGTHILDIVKHLMSLNFSVSSSKAICARCVCVAKMMIKKNGVLTLLATLVMDGPVVQMRWVTHFQDPGLYTSTKVVIFLMIQAADAFVDNDYKPVLFHASSKYRHARALLDELYFYHME